MLDGKFGSYVHLPQNQLSDRLNLNKGNMFMISHKRGFYVDAIIKSTPNDQMELKKILSQTNLSLDLYPTNFEWSQS